MNVKGLGKKITSAALALVMAAALLPAASPKASAAVTFKTGTQYYICSALNNDKVVNQTLNGSNNVSICTRFDVSQQKWTFSDAGGGWYYIKCGTNRYLDIYNCRGSNGENVSTWPSYANNSAKWKLINNGNGYYYLQSYYTNSKGTPYCLDLSNGGLRDETNIQLWEKVNGCKNQLWKLKEVINKKNAVTNNANLFVKVTASKTNTIPTGNVTLSCMYTGESLCANRATGNNDTFMSSVYKADNILVTNYTTEACRWTLESAGNGQYYIKNVKKGTYLTIQGRLTTRGAWGTKFNVTKMEGNMYCITCPEWNNYYFDYNAAQWQITGGKTPSGSRWQQEPTCATCLWFIEEA